MRRRAFVLASVGVAATIAGCAGGDGEAGDGENPDLPQEATISIADGEFDPLTVHVGSGGTVTWENDTDESFRVNSIQLHTGSEGWSFGETIEAGESASHTFENAGRYDFIEPNYGQFTMCGRVRVGSAEEGESLPCE